MKLIVIYGPTAAGKHTVGQQLADLTGYKFFYNHLTVDVVRSIFGDGDPVFGNEDPRRRELLDTLRLDVFDAVARDGVDTIFTMAYVPTISPEFTPRLIETVTKHGGMLHFVRLTPPDATLYERIGNESRHKLNKPTNPEHLRYKLTTYDCRVKIEYPSTIDLDTSKLTPPQAARQIIEAFGL